MVETAQWKSQVVSGGQAVDIEKPCNDGCVPPFTHLVTQPAAGLSLFMQRIALLLFLPSEHSESMRGLSVS